MSNRARIRKKERVHVLEAHIKRSKYISEREKKKERKREREKEAT